MEDSELEKMLKEGNVKACSYCKIVYKIEMVNGKEEFTSLMDVEFEKVSKEHHQPHPRCEENYNLDPTRFGCGHH